MPSVASFSAASSAAASATASAVTHSAVPWVRDRLMSGPQGVLALAVVAALVQVPVTQYRTFYGISVGYGLAVAAMGLALVGAFPGPHAAPGPPAAAAATVFYGLRLGLYLLGRDQTARRRQHRRHSAPGTALIDADRTPRLRRVGLALALSLLYAAIAAPLLYALRGVAEAAASEALPRWKRAVSTAGSAVAWTGAVLEAAADGHKARVKARAAAAAAAVDQKGPPDRNRTAFVGPTTGLYRLTRHPNYAAELAFWCGLSLTGLPFLGGSPVAWLASAGGLASITAIMVGAADRLEARQRQAYGGQTAYEDWVAQVPAVLVPGIR